MGIKPKSLYIGLTKVLIGVEDCHCDKMSSTPMVMVEKSKPLYIGSHKYVLVARNHAYFNNGDGFGSMWFCAIGIFQK